MKIKIYKSKLEGEIIPPFSKSVSHRALICGALSRGKSVINNLLICDDTIATIDCLKKMGADISIENSKCFIDGTNFLSKKEGFLNCNNSASTLRMLIPFSMIDNNHFTFTGERTLLRRPLNVYDKFAKENDIHFVKEDNVDVSGNLEGNEFSILGNSSSQFISGLIFALCFKDDDFIIHIEDEMVSRPYVIMTISILKKLGKNINLTSSGIEIKKSQIKPFEFEVEADESACAVLDAFNLFENNISLIKDKTEYQGDVVYKNFYKYNLGNMINLENCPDLGPILMTVSALKCDVMFNNTSRLQDKESNRIKCLQDELSKIGCKMNDLNNSVIVHKCDYEIYSNVSFDSHNDHRLVMVETLIGSLIGCEIENFECISKSYPKFFEDLSKIGLKYEIED